MSNILIIKHGSLGDISQASGAIQDISENHKNDQIYLLTTKPFFDLFKKNPFIHEVILDKRLPKFLDIACLLQLNKLFLPILGSLSNILPLINAFCSAYLDTVNIAF